MLHDGYTAGGYTSSSFLLFPGDCLWQVSVLQWNICCYSLRGDLLSAQNETGAIMQDMLDQVQEDECPDVTIPEAADITFQSSSRVMMSEHFTLESSSWSCQLPV